MAKTTTSVIQTKKKKSSAKKVASKTKKPVVKKQTIKKKNIKTNTKKQPKNKNSIDLKIETNLIPEEDLEFNLFTEEKKIIKQQIPKLKEKENIKPTTITVKKSDLVKTQEKLQKHKEISDKKFPNSTDAQFLEALETKMKTNLVEVENYEILKNMITVKIVNEEGNFYYLIKEPSLSESETALIELLKESIIQLSDGTKRTIGERIDTATNRFMLTIPKESIEKLKYFIRRDFLGYGIIDAIMHDPQIEDISCNGVNNPIFINHRKYGSIETNIEFETMDKLKSYVVRISQQCGKFISFAEPLMDGTLPDGSRVQSTYGAGITVNGPTFSIRKITKTPITPLDLIRYKTLSSEMVAYLWLVIENKMNVLISGGTATGKTAMLNSLAMFIPKNLKIVSVE
ncbi:MAG: type II/IV secretion system ATPase subunit, partial [Candidatus Diapherotrites archaeon]|nr:type II/IV secretion system ATPase subunit [Candidatus Diapherotrites archaeon]